MKQDGSTIKDDLLKLAIAGAIRSGLAYGLPPEQWLRGMDASECAIMMETLFPDGDVPQPRPALQLGDALDSEFADLYALLREAAEPSCREDTWLACAIASAALLDNHLWQDLQLPDRSALSQLLHQRFSGLAQRNTGKMRWKAFFYKQLCERAGNVCRAPSCSACDDYEECFGAE